MNSGMNFLLRISILGLFGFTAGAAAQGLGPEQLVQKVTEEVMTAIKSNKQLAAGDRQKAMKLAEEKVLPYVDFEQATRLAVGRAWPQATPEQRKKLVSEFRNMLVRTYSNAIEGYQGQTLKVLPSRGGKQDAKDETTVRTQFVRAGGKPLPIEFQMRKTGEGWKVFRKFRLACRKRCLYFVPQPPFAPRLELNLLATGHVPLEDCIEALCGCRVQDAERNFIVDLETAVVEIA